MKWSSQPVCGCCWQAYSYGARGEIVEAVKAIDPEREVCVFCGGWADQGIYLRVDEEKVPFPNINAANWHPEDLDA